MSKKPTVADREREGDRRLQHDLAVLTGGKAAPSPPNPSPPSPTSPPPAPPAAAGSSKGKTAGEGSPKADPPTEPEIEDGPKTSDAPTEPEVEDGRRKDLKLTVYLNKETMIRLRHEQHRRERAGMNRKQAGPSQLLIEAVAKAFPTPKCGNCGILADPGAAFCASCGHRI